jgi:predicted dinucleotide-binding enzyme
MNMSIIGVIGAGHIGRSFSIAAIRAGHEVVISNSQGPDTLSDLVSELGPNARAKTAEDAAAAGDFALVAIPLKGTVGVPVEPLAGKVVLTTNNYFAKRDGPIAEIDSGEMTVPAYLQAHLPTSKVVRAFNHIDAAQIVSDGTPDGAKLELEVLRWRTARPRCGRAGEQSRARGDGGVRDRARRPLRARAGVRLQIPAIAPPHTAARVTTPGHARDFGPRTSAMLVWIHTAR